MAVRGAEVSCTKTHPKRTLREKADDYSLRSLVEALESYAAICWHQYRDYRRAAKLVRDFNEVLWCERQAVEAKHTLKLLLAIRREGLGR